MTKPSPSSPDRIADAPSRSWIDALPAAAKPYARLARLDRPIGWWLLLLPCWWSATLGAAAQGAPLPDPVLFALFLVGAVAMRGVGCTYNDIVDRDIDAQVARTRRRPLPSGQVTLRGAWAFLGAQSLAGLAVLLALKPAAQVASLAALPLIALYPFMKRWTMWPQAWLGLTFSWGALVGYPAATGSFAMEAFLLYAGAILWVVGYDTIYAHQDKEDDALIGVGSSALALGRMTKPFLAAVYGGAALLFALAGWAADLGLGFAIGWTGGAAHLLWQIRALDLDDPLSCLRIFKSNRDFGIILLVAMLVGLWI